MKKIVFITGTSTGFGKLTATTLAGVGFQVLAGMRGTKGHNAQIAAEMAKIPNIDVVDIDVTDDQSVEKAFTYAIDKYGRVDVLVNNAALAGFGVLEAYTIDQIKKMFDVNFYGVIRTIQAVLPSMRAAKSGLIINISTGASGHTLPFMIPYMASKFGVESITEGLQDELQDFGIDSVSIQSGVYPTEMNTGAKAGLQADKPAVIAEYGESSQKRAEAMGTGLFGKMAEFKMNPQTIADGILELINMQAGKRPLRFPLDAIAQGTDKEFIEARAAIKAKWLAKYSA
jgi:NAD(P)-dependent dehydrogenase (short-subunit alcohol dehydrogenase family)